MAIKMGKEDYEALERKLEYLDEKVLCPRCGNEIVWVKNWKFNLC